MIWVYILKSTARNYIYVGMTNNLKRRIEEHNIGYNKTTRPYAPFQLVHKEEFNTRVEARKKEKYFKSGSGKEYIKKNFL